MNNKRRLGFWETVHQYLVEYYSGEATIVAVAKIRGQIDSARLRDALQKVQMQQPLLRSHVTKETDGYYYIVDGDPKEFPFVTHIRQSSNNWQLVAEKNLDYIFPNNIYQWRLTLLQDQNNQYHELVLNVGHNIFDGFSAAVFFYNLFKYYENPSKPVEPLALLPPIERFVSHIMPKEIKPPETYHPYYLPFATTKAKADYATKVQYINYGKLKTQQLLSFCKNNELSLNSILQAAMAKAYVRLVGKEIDLDLSTPVSLRKYAKPKISEDYCGVCVSCVSDFVKNISPNCDVIHLAKDHNARLKNDLLPNAAILPAEFSFQVIEEAFTEKVVLSEKQFTADPQVSNLGALPFKTVFLNLCWDEFYFATSRKKSIIPIAISTASLNSSLMMTFTHLDPLASKNKVHMFVEYFFDVLSELA